MQTNTYSVEYIDSLAILSCIARAIMTTAICPPLIRDGAISVYGPGIQVLLQLQYNYMYQSISPGEHFVWSNADD